MTFPLITVAAVNGHGMSTAMIRLTAAFAGGMLLALACDFRIMNADKGMMSMNEVSACRRCGPVHALRLERGLRPGNPHRSICTFSSCSQHRNTYHSLASSIQAHASRGTRANTQLLIGLPLPNSFATFLQMRLSGPVLRDTMLAKRWKQSELLAHGLIDEMVPEDKVLSRSIEVAKAEGTKIGLGTWGSIKVGWALQDQPAGQYFPNQVVLSG